MKEHTGEHTRVFDDIDRHFDEHVKALQAFLRQDSLSLVEGHNPNVDKCAAMLRDYVSELGARAELVEFDEGYPVVFGKLNSKNPAAKTVIFYSLYDIMPYNEEGWVVDPLAAEIVDARDIFLPPDYGRCIAARGARNQKGPTMGFIKAVESMLRVYGDVPVNILWAVEGEEEICSRNLPNFRDRYLDELKQADAVWYGNPSEDEEGIHHVHCGAKGLLSVDLVCEGGEWGGPARLPLFAADANWVDSPAWRLLHALCSLKDAHGNITMRGFLDDRREPTPQEKASVEEIKAGFNEAAVAKRLGIRRFLRGKSGKDLIESYVLGPVLNLDGVVSGYTGPWVFTNFPRRAVAKLDIRLVPDMDPQKALKKLRAHLDAEGFPEVTIKVHGGYRWFQTDPQADVVRAAISAAMKHGRKSVIWPLYYACIPLSVFADPPLSLPAVSCGIGKMGRPHMPNEFFTLDGLRDYEKYVVTFLHDFART